MRKRTFLLQIVVKIKKLLCQSNVGCKKTEEQRLQRHILNSQSLQPYGNDSQTSRVTVRPKANKILRKAVFSDIFSYKFPLTGNPRPHKPKLI